MDVTLLQYIRKLRKASIKDITNAVYEEQLVEEIKRLVGRIERNRARALQAPQATEAPQAQEEAPQATEAPQAQQAAEALPAMEEDEATESEEDRTLLELQGGIATVSLDDMVQATPPAKKKSGYQKKGSPTWS
jgi:phosphoglycolate phosphatase-like HAD superfamily hydrolase